MEFPRYILLVRPSLYETDFETILEGTLLKPVEAFDTAAIAGFRFETVIVCWQDFAARDDSPLLEDTRRRLVDWINTEVMKRCRESRRPVWV